MPYPKSFRPRLTYIFLIPGGGRRGGGGGKHGGRERPRRKKKPTKFRMLLTSPKAFGEKKERKILARRDGNWNKPFSRGEGSGSGGWRVGGIRKKDLYNFILKEKEKKGQMPGEKEQKRFF